MTHNFGALVFTPAVRALQEKYGSRRQYARMQETGASRDALGPDEHEFLEQRDSFYMASTGASGWPYVQHRGGPKGFLKVLDDHTLAFADFRGNKQYISVGNLITGNKVALILVDYPGQARLKILGQAEILAGEEAKEWVERLGDPPARTVIERIIVIRIEAFDWNCQQHITPRFTTEQIREVLGPLEERLTGLQRENESLRARLAQVGKTEPPAAYAV